MFYITGDLHGQFDRVRAFCKQRLTLATDVLIVLGDPGVNNFKGEKDKKIKEAIKKLPITLFCIHRKLEIKPYNVPSYKIKKWNVGLVY